MTQSAIQARDPSAAPRRQRDERLDVVRFLLMFLILFGHSSELFYGNLQYLVYRSIYIFHIPAFLFLTGYFARFNGKKLLQKFFLPYLVVQAAYLLFQGYVIDGAETVVLQFTSPYWMLWYLLVILYDYLLTPVLDCFRGKACLLVILGTVALSVLSGYDSSITYYMALARFFNFLPFFVTGYYVGRGALPRIPALHGKTARILLSLPAAAGMVLSVLWVWKANVGHLVLYGACGYADSGGSPLHRVLLLAAAGCWILVIFLWTPRVPFRLIPFLGRNTFFVFLVHGFILRLEGKAGLFCYSEVHNLLLAALNAALLYLVLGGLSGLWHSLRRRCRERTRPPEGACG